MTKVSVSAEFDALVRELWEVIDGFNALPEWHPGVAASAIKYADGGTVRILEAADGGRIVERIEDVDYDGHAYTYSIVESTLPISRYVSTLRVRKARQAGAGARCGARNLPPTAFRRPTSPKALRIFTAPASTIWSAYWPQGRRRHRPRNVAENAAAGGAQAIPPAPRSGARPPRQAPAADPSVEPPRAAL